MPSSLLSARIRGIRSYSPAEDDCQTIEFMPLTLIVGSNGTGKTTIIEALKFIISGEEPPHADCRRNFIHTPNHSYKQHTSSDEIYALIEIVFKNSFGERCIAKRELTRYGPTKTAPPSLSSGYKIGQSPWIYVHRQDDWNKVMPRLFGLPNQSILSNIILCHQEDNLWCMGDSAGVKLVFDKIFGCEQYKREIKNIDEEIKISKRTIDSSEKDIIRFGEQVKRKKSVLIQIDRLAREIKMFDLEVEKLDSEVKVLAERKNESADKLRASETRAKDIQNLEIRIRSLVERDSSLRNSLNSVTYKRPAHVERVQPVPKKPAPDPIVCDLNSVSENLNKMTSVIDTIPLSDDLNNLKVLIDDTLVMVQSIMRRFVVRADEPPTPPPSNDPSPEEILLKKLEETRKSIQIQVDDNLRNLEELRGQVKAMQKAQNDTDDEQAKRELDKIEHELLQARDKRAHKSGSKIQMERELSNLKFDLSNFKNSNKDYAKSLGLMVSSKIIIADLEKLKKCFQDSITSFHDQMILKINEVLRSRWRQIYQGNDIETIELVDEPITRGKGQKSYNYYMAMRKCGTRMKMREKSSAGQRALAAIILRMTLAELFVKDFAFIALDEPTANLDSANVQALARSIGSYVRKRNKKGANIQWIIITHDEQFLRALDEECSPFFYRIVMDKTSGYSQIKKVSCQDAVSITQDLEAY